MVDKNRVIELMSEYKIPGVVVGVCNKEQVLDLFSLGYSSIDNSIEMKEDFMFPLGSCVKSFTTLMLAKFVDEGKLGWDDLAKNVIKGFSLQNKDLEESLTLVEMLSHQSGISKNSLLWDFKPMTRNDLVELLPQLECFEKNKGVYIYNNIVYTVLEKLTGDISHSSYEEAVEKTLFHPIHLENTTCDLEKFKCNTKAVHPFVINENRLKECSINHVSIKEVAGTTIFSDVYDVMRFLQFYLNRGILNGKQYISYQNISTTITPYVKVKARNLELFNSKNDTYYCMGWMSTHFCNKKMIYHEGRSFGCNAMLCFFPEDDLGIVILSNREHDVFSLQIVHMIAEKLYGEQENNQQKINSDLLQKKESNDHNRFIWKDHDLPVTAEGITFSNKIYGEIKLSSCSSYCLRLEYYSLSTDACKENNKIICYPTTDIFSMRNKLGKDGRLIFDYEMNKNGELIKLILNNEPEVANIEFERIG